MKQFILVLPALAILAGCASSETGTVYKARDGTTVYGLNEQPESSVTGSGALMPGAYASHNMMTGQFTGQERTQDLIGQRPETPREADARVLQRNPAPTIGTGAGTLGQSGIVPNGNVTGSALVDLPPDLAAVAARNNGQVEPVPNSPEIASSQQPNALNGSISPDNTSKGANKPGEVAIGSAPGAESASGSSTSNNPSLSAGVNQSSRPSAAVAPQPAPAQAKDTADLPARIKESLGNTKTITPAELKTLEVDAVNGDVTLRGDVRTQKERTLIGDKVAKMQGVHSVNNQLRVIGASPASPAIPEQSPFPNPNTGVKQ
jgi:hypothetical protein